MIEAEYRDPRLTLARVAARGRCSVSLAARLLKQHDGQGFRGRLKRVRMIAAGRLLHESVMNVNEIADRVGYGSSSQFGRHFKRHYGATPLRFRRGRSPMSKSYDK
jgi:AraC-like DNA-binding protein